MQRPVKAMKMGPAEFKVAAGPEELVELPACEFEYIFVSVFMKEILA